VIFVPNAEVGERCDVKIVKEGRKFMIGEIANEKADNPYKCSRCGYISSDTPTRHLGELI